MRKKFKYTGIAMSVSRTRTSYPKCPRKSCSKKNKQKKHWKTSKSLTIQQKHIINYTGNKKICKSWHPGKVLQSFSIRIQVLCESVSCVTL